MFLWCILYQRRRWLLPRLRWRMHAKYPANNGAHASIYSEGAWRRPRYSSVESISLPTLRKLFILNSRSKNVRKFSMFSKFSLKIYNYWNISVICQKSDKRKIEMKSTSREIALCDYFHLVWKKFKSWMSRKLIFRFYFSFEFLVWKRFTSFYSFW